jgi:hypothetical protein
MDMKFGRTSLFIWIVFLWLVMCLEVGLLLYPHPGGIGRFAFAFLVFVPLVFLLKRLEYRWRTAAGRYVSEDELYKLPKLSPSRLLIAMLVIAAWIALVVTGMMWSTRFNDGWLTFVWIGVLLTIFSFLEVKWQKQDARGTDHGSDGGDARD